MHGSRDRLAERPGKGHGDDEPDECGADGDPEHGGARRGDRRFRLGPVVEAIGRHQFHEIVERRDSLVALPRQREGRGDLGQAARRRLEDLQSGARPAAEAGFSLLAGGLDVRTLDPITDHTEIFGNVADQLFKPGNGFARRPVGQAVLHDEARLVQARMRRARVVDSHQGSVIEAHHQIARGGDTLNSVECEPAGEQDDDAEGAENLVADRHHKSPATPSGAISP